MKLFPGRNKKKKARTITLVVDGKTDVGKVRSGNEDCYRIVKGKKAPDGIDAIMVVADGMGGHAAGEVASEMTADGVIRHLTSHSSNTAIAEKYHEFLARIVSKVNQEVHRAGQDPDHQGMGTTCTMGVLRGLNLHIAHVGDSRAYLLRDHTLSQITKDHGWVAEQVEAGNLTIEEAKDHPYRNVVTRAIGIDKNVQTDTFTVRLQPGDKVLLCSDGLHSMVEDAEIAKLLRNNVKIASDKLIAIANSNGGSDNITVIAAEIRGPAVKGSTKRVNKKTKQIKKRKPRNSSGPIGWIKTRLLRRSR